MSNLIEAIERLFHSEYSATKAKYGDYNPFAGHSEDDHKEGKSYFFSDIDRGFGNEFGDAEAIILSETMPDPNTRIVTVGFEWPDPDEPFEREHVKTWERYIDIGNYAITMDEYPQAELKIRPSPNHGDLQFFGRKEEWRLMETATTTATVILSREGGKWLLATAFPGPASAHNSPELMKKLQGKEILNQEVALREKADTTHVILLSNEEFDKL